MENQGTRKSSNWVMAAAILALIAGAAALALNWQARTDNQKSFAALAVLQLRAAVLSSRPYDAELSALKGFAASSPAVDGALADLRKYELTGLPSLQALDDQFQKAAAAALVAEQSRPSLGLLNSVTSHIAATAVAIGMETDSYTFDSVLTTAISTAEGLLTEGQLAQSVAAIDEIPDEYASNFDAWKASVESRVAAEEALNGLVSEYVPVAQPVK